jgi:ubiquinone/menaquinone biosynthesis C-methylase UbiE
MPDFSRRSSESELMDDPLRPDNEFADAYRELAIVNRRLGGIRAIEQFLPSGSGTSILDVGAGGCDLGEALSHSRVGAIVSLDMNPRGLQKASRTIPIVGDARRLPFMDNAFDVVMASLFFHHLTPADCVQVLREMWRTAKRLVIVNDLHRHRAAYVSIRILSELFSKSVMFRNDAGVSVLRAFRPNELLEVARQAGVPGRVHRCFPYRLVLVAHK